MKYLNENNARSFINLTTLGINCPLRPLRQLPQVLDEIAKAGFKYLYFNEIFHPGKSKKEIKQIKRAVENSGLKVHSSHFLHILPSPWQTMEWMLEKYKRDLDIAAEFGMRFVTTHFGWMAGLDDPRLIKKSIFNAYQKNSIKNAKILYDEVIRKIGGEKRYLEMNFEAYRYLCAEGKKRGVSPTIETACCNRTKTPAMIIKLIKKIGCSNLGICLDSGHSHIMGIDVAKAIRESGKYLFETHFHDNFGETDLHRPIGFGTINWLEAIRALADIGYNDVINFESSGLGDGNYLEEMKMYYINWNFFVKIAKFLQKSKGE